MMGTTVICAGKCEGRTKSFEEALAGLSAGVTAGLKAELQKHEVKAAAGLAKSLAGCGKAPEDKKRDCREKFLCCNNVPGRGSMYAKSSRLYSEPSTNSTVVGSPPSGTRLRYTNTTQVNGQTWYYIDSPGPQRQGWMTGNSLSCTRPVEPPSPKIIRPIDSTLGPPSSRAAHANAARG